MSFREIGSPLTVQGIDTILEISPVEIIAYLKYPVIIQVIGSEGHFAIF